MGERQKYRGFLYQYRVEVLSAMTGARSISHRMIYTMIGGHPRKASTHSCVSAKENEDGETVSREYELTVHPLPLLFE